MSVSRSANSSNMDVAASMTAANQPRPVSPSPEDVARVQATEEGFDGEDPRAIDEEFLVAQ